MEGRFEDKFLTSVVTNFYGIKVTKNRKKAYFHCQKLLFKFSFSTKFRNEKCSISKVTYGNKFESGKR